MAVGTVYTVLTYKIFPSDNKEQFGNNVEKSVHISCKIKQNSLCSIIVPFLYTHLRLK